MAGQFIVFSEDLMRTISVLGPDPEAFGPAMHYFYNITFHTNYFQGSCGQEVLMHEAAIIL